jgi:predicted metal-dependent HD superfamily phosphohydrolase
MTLEQGLWFSHINGQYTRPGRYYHDNRHLRCVLSLLQHWSCEKGYTAIPSPLFYAALFHDAIYDAHRTDNEERSAELCRLELETAQVRPGVIARSAALILSTKSHQPVDKRFDATALLDADLWILGSSPADYANYTTLIRMEYSHVSTNRFAMGRTLVLQRFLARPRIYWGDGPRFSRRERQARQNLEQEIQHWQQ